MTVRHMTWAVLIAAAGCGGGEPRREVGGRVAGPAAELAGHLVEVSAPDDPNIRGSGVIGPDGRFQLAGFQKGQQLPGLRDGTYRARLVIVDEGDGQTKRPKVPARFLNFQQSGWSVRVPADGEVVLTVAAK